MPWRSRGYLPHLDGAEFIQHVVFHLADSLPRDVVERLDRESRELSNARRDEVRRERIDALLDSGRGRCVLREPEVAARMQEALLFFHGDRYRLIAWTVMPNHVHALFRTLEGWTLGKVIGSWKAYGGRRIREWLRADGGKLGTELTETVPNRTVADAETIWHREYFDRYMRDEEQLQATIRYIHANPVEAGLVASAADWPWSSAFPKNAKRLKAEN